MIKLLIMMVHFIQKFLGDGFNFLFVFFLHLHLTLFDLDFVNIRFDDVQAVGVVFDYFLELLPFPNNQLIFLLLGFVSFGDEAVECVEVVLALLTGESGGARPIH